MTQGDLFAALGGHAARISQAAQQVLDMAGIGADQVGTVILVGGSSLMRVVEAQLATLCPGAEMTRGDAFTAITDGLAIAAARPFDSHPV